MCLSSLNFLRLNILMIIVRRCILFAVFKIKMKRFSVTQTNVLFI
jgi:hypothetical protein